jgi:hypothetical protein
MKAFLASDGSRNSTRAVIQIAINHFSFKGPNNCQLPVIPLGGKIILPMKPYFSNRFFISFPSVLEGKFFTIIMVFDLFDVG